METGLPLVLFVGGDPGGAAAVAPVMSMLQKHGKVMIQGLAYHEAADVWSAQGLSYWELFGDLDQAQVQAFLRVLNPALVVTGTSINDHEYEKMFIAGAKESAIPTLAVLDFWSNYSHRFSDSNGSLIFLPDRIAVMDDFAVSEMAGAGFPEDILVVTGQPAFDDLVSIRTEFRTEDRRAVREQLGFDLEDLLVVFYSQPFSELFGTEDSHPRYPGFDEFSVLHALMAALEQLSAQISRSIRLVISPHLREKPEKFEGVTGNAVQVSVEDSIEARRLSMAADLVTGMTSTRLVEACYLGQIVLSIQVGLKKPDDLFINRQGFSVGVYQQEAILPVISKYLLNEEVRQEQIEKLNAFSPSEFAAKKVAELVYQMIQERSGKSGKQGKEKAEVWRMPC